MNVSILVSSLKSLYFRSGKSTTKYYNSAGLAGVAFRKLDPTLNMEKRYSGFLMDYNLFASSYRPQGGSSSNNLNAYGTTGLNAGAWRST